jgi:hypothetical protein
LGICGKEVPKFFQVFGAYFIQSIQEVYSEDRTGPPVVEPEYDTNVIPPLRDVSEIYRYVG